MMLNPSISLIVPGIRTQNWQKLYEEAKEACSKFSYELILIGPKPLPSFFDDKDEVRYIKCHSSPSVSLMNAVSICRGEYFTWILDDADLKKDSIDSALNVMKDEKDETIMFTRYVERENGQENETPNFIQAWTHNDLKLPLIQKDWKIAPVMLLKTSFFKQLGGIDCVYEHINASILDFNFRAQMNGSKLIPSPQLIMSCELQRNRTVDNNPIIQAWFENDKPILTKNYSEPGNVEVLIDYDNWLEFPSVWPRKKKIIESGQYFIGDQES